MTARLDKAHRAWELQRDEDSHRTYTIAHLVETAKTDGPHIALNCPGLPAVGSYWSFDDDSDPYATCWPTARVTIHEELEGDPVTIYRVEQVFSTKPFERCQDTNIENPLLEPCRISGNFVRYQEEIQYDRYGNQLRTSSWEPIKGPNVEIDRSRPKVRIEMNVGILQLANFAQYVNCVNSVPMWGLPTRCVKLSDIAWERKIYGVCSKYYTIVFDFDISYNTFDRYAYDYGTKVLRGSWDRNKDSPSYKTWVIDSTTPPDPDNPQDFVAYTDWGGEPAAVFLDGKGLPANQNVWRRLNKNDPFSEGAYITGQPAVWKIEAYDEIDFAILQIPLLLE